MTSIDTQDTTLSAVFHSHVISPEQTAKIVERVLDYRAKASDGARSRLDSAIRDNINMVGFRDASRAQSQRLREPVLYEIVKRNDKMAGAVLKMWAESREDLQRAVTDHFESLGIPTEGPDLRAGKFNSLWLRSEWQRERDAISAEDSEGRFDVDDIGLMACFVSGKLSDPNRVETASIESTMFLEWIETLRELRADAPDWDDMGSFIMALSQLAEDKAEARVDAQIEALETTVAETVEEFEGELQYLELRIGSWAEVGESKPHRLSEALELAEEMKAKLAEYRPIRPQGASREEELLRAVERAEREAAIYGTAERWRRRMSLPDDYDYDPARPEGGDDAPPDVEHGAEGSPAPSDGAQEGEDAALAEVGESVGVSIGVSMEEYESVRSQMERIERDGASLRSENDRLRDDNDGLRADRSQLDAEISKLKSKLSLKSEMEEYWRSAYVSESARRTSAEEDEAAQVSSVNDALALAERTFPQKLVVALNSKSAKNSPFQKPKEVFAALAWLATEYHTLRTNPGSRPDFNSLIKEACPGWSYKSGQTEVTKEQFDEWYTTALGGKTYHLNPHIGKGTSHDPQNTIRIAFDWDDEQGKVIVGFLGLHQRNRRT